MIQVENLSYGFPTKDLYHKVSFTLNEGEHCALIGSNGAGKSTLVDLIIQSDQYLYDGTIRKEPNCRIGYASEFAVREKEQECTVFEYLSARFVENQEATVAVCEEMAKADDIEPLFQQYQALLDAFVAMDGEHYTNNIRKQLYQAGMRDLEQTKISELSGGEYKLLQIMREMLLSQNLLVLDEPDVFLDFGNLHKLCQVLNGYQGTLLVITHNRYLLNHCFNKILHLENGDIQEYDGNYTEYRCSQLQEKLRLRQQSIAEQAEIERTEKMVDILRTRATLLVNPVIGSAVNAKQTQLDRLLARQIKAPFVEFREPKITLPAADFTTDQPVLRITDYQVSFDECLLEKISFDLQAGEKVALVGANGTGKTTLMRDILTNHHPSIQIDGRIRYAYLSQLQGENFDETKTIYEVMEHAGFPTREASCEYLKDYCLEGDTLSQKVEQLSGGEKNLLQIALLSTTKTSLLILDEPTSHLDLTAQIALEKAIFEYQGAVLMVSHDFYLVANCADYVLLIEDNTIRRIRTRSFRKLVYTNYFDQSYLELDKRRQELEANIALAFQNDDLVLVEKLCNQLEALRLQ